MNCPKCGTATFVGATYCHVCATPVDGSIPLTNTQNRVPEKVTGGSLAKILGGLFIVTLTVIFVAKMMAISAYPAHRVSSVPLSGSTVASAPHSKTHLPDVRQADTASPASSAKASAKTLDPSTGHGSDANYGGPADAACKHENVIVRRALRRDGFKVSDVECQLVDCNDVRGGWTTLVVLYSDPVEEHVRERASNTLNQIDWRGMGFKHVGVEIDYKSASSDLSDVCMYQASEGDDSNWYFHEETPYASPFIDSDSQSNN